VPIATGAILRSATWMDFVLDEQEMGTYLAKDLTHFGTCDIVPLIAKDVIRRVHVVSVCWM